MPDILPYEFVVSQRDRARADNRILLNKLQQSWRTIEYIRKWANSNVEKHDPRGVSLNHLNEYCCEVSGWGPCDCGARDLWNILDGTNTSNSKTNTPTVGEDTGK